MSRVQRLTMQLICIVSGASISSVLAQHSQHHGGHHRVHSHLSVSSDPAYWSTPPYNPYISPVSGGAGYQLQSSGLRGHHHHHHQPNYAPIFVSSGPAWLATPILPSPPMAILPSVSVIPVVYPTPLGPQDNPAKLPAKPSTAAGKLKSLEQQALGDEKLRKSQWALAYMNYRSAADAAGDRGEARLRLGFCYTAMKQYSSAIREFKRGLFLNPELSASGIRLPILFGPGSEIVRTSIVNKVADWVREDNRDSDRWFVLGVLLRYEDDPRAVEALKAARQLANGDDDHIVALLKAPLDKPPLPADAVVGKPAMLLELPPPPFADPAPIAPAAVPAGNGLPPLSDQPMPPLVAPLQ